jgi:hypothetical protein
MKYLLLLPLICLTGCAKNQYLSLMSDKIDARYLASTHVGTPDPRQANPPQGQRIVIAWYVPGRILEERPEIRLHLLFWNNTTQVVCYPIYKGRGNKVFFLLGDEFIEKKGILTYKAEIVTADGSVFSEWKHQLWVNFIEVEQDIPEALPEYPNSRLDPIEEIYEEEEMSDEFFYPPPDRMLREELPPVPEGEISPQQHEMDQQS